MVNTLSGGIASKEMPDVSFDEVTPDTKEPKTGSGGKVYSDCAEEWDSFGTGSANSYWMSM